MIDKYNLKLCKEKLEELIEEYIRVRYTYKNISNLGEDYYSKGMAYKFSDNCNMEEF